MVRRAVEGAIQFFFLFLLFVMSLLCIGLPYFTEFRLFLSDLLLHHPHEITRVGLGLLGVVCGFGGIVYRLQSRKMLYVRIPSVHEGTNAIRGVFSLRVRFIQKALTHALRTTYPKMLSPVRVEIDRARSNREAIEVGVTLPWMSQEALQSWLNQAESLMASLLRDKFGYRGAVIVRVEFHPSIAAVDRGPSSEGKGSAATLLEKPS